MSWIPVFLLILVVGDSNPTALVDAALQQILATRTLRAEVTWGSFNNGEIQGREFQEWVHDDLGRVHISSTHCRPVADAEGQYEVTKMSEFCFDGNTSFSVLHKLPDSDSKPLLVTSKEDVPDAMSEPYIVIRDGYTENFMLVKQRHPRDLILGQFVDGMDRIYDAKTYTLTCEERDGLQVAVHDKKSEQPVCLQ